MDEKVIFWNVDTQKDFILTNGKLAILGAEAILPNLAYLTKTAKEENITVVNTCDFHGPDDPEISDTPDFKTTFPSHCIAGTEGQEFIPETYPHQFGRENHYVVGIKNPIDEGTFEKARNIIIEKNKFDVFEGNPNTEKVLELLKPTIVVVYGVAADVCVKFAVLGLLKRGYKVALLADCCKELPNADMDAIKKEFEPYKDLLKITTLEEVRLEW